MKLLLLKLASCATVFASSASAAKPNIIVVMFDDLGGRELSCYGNTFNETPRIDKLAAEGVRFNRAYAPTPICSPTRATLLTGESPARHGITDFLEDKDDNFLDPALHTTVAKTLKLGGYRTGLIGKWHLRGDYSENRGTPAQHGFDEAILTETSYIAGGDYRYPYSHIANVKQKIFPTEDLTDRLNLEAVEFIERNHAKPFFLYLAHYAVHTRLDAPDSVVARFNSKRGTPGDAASPTRNPVLAAMAKGVDAGVGAILAKLKALGLDSNTLVIVTSDNGGDPSVTDNGELRLGKGSPYEGGIRIPFIARWPGFIPAGRVSERPIGHADLHPTFAALAGAMLPVGQAMDGINIESLLRGSGEIAPRSMTWHFPRVTADGNQSFSALLDAKGRKLIRFYDTDKLELFLPGTDASENMDLAPASPAEARAMAKELFGTINIQQAGYEFRDDFTDKDKSGWQDFGGDWGPGTGAYIVPAGEGFRSMTEDRYFSDLVYQAQVTPPASGNAGLVFRSNSNAVGRFAFRGYFAYLDPAAGEVVLSRCDGAAATQIGRKTMVLAAGKPTLLRIAARGPELKVFVDDTSKAVITVRDSAFDGGLIGLRAHAGAGIFDNLYAHGLAGKTPPVGLGPTVRKPATSKRAIRFNGTWNFRHDARWNTVQGKSSRPGPAESRSRP